MLGCDRIFYYPSKQQYDSPETCRLTYEPVTIPTPDGQKLHGFFFPSHGKAARGTVLHLHGNAGNISGHFQQVAWLPEHGFNVLCFDYRGYGQSTGTVSRAGTIIDANAALDYLLARQDIDSKRIVVFGQSLGGAIGIVLAAQRTEIRGLAVDGAFDSYRRIASWHVRRSPLLLAIAWWVPWALSRSFDPIDSVQRISPRPLLILHGTADQVVPVEMGRRLYQQAGEPKKIILFEGADHYQALQERTEESHPPLLAFFEKCVERGSTQPALLADE